MEFNPFGSTAASLGSALGKGIASPIEQAMELLGQKKLYEIQSAQKNQLLNQQKNQKLDVLSKRFGRPVAELLVELGDKGITQALSNPMELFQLSDALNNGQEMFNQDNISNQDSVNDFFSTPKFKNPYEKDLRSLYSDVFTPEHTKLARNKDRRDEEKMINQVEQFERKQEFAEKKFGYEQTQKFRDEVSKLEEEADHTLALLGRQKELNKDDKLPHPLQTKFLRDLGLEFALNPDAQEFAGLEKEFLKGARSIFGGRVTNFEMSQFLRGIPTLMQSKEGRDRIIRNLELMARLKKLKADTTNKIMKNHKNPPANLADLVSQKSRNKRDRLLNDFVTGGETLKVIPNPKNNNGKLLKMPDGSWKISNGDKWKDISQEEVDKLTGML